MTKTETKVVALTAAMILEANHPVNKHLVADCGARNVPVSKRQAREFLRRFPAYKGV